MFGIRILQILWNVDPEIFKIGGFSIRYYSVLFALSFIVGYWLMKSMFKKEGLNEKHLGSFLVYILVGTVVGARLGQTLFYEFDYYKDHILEIILPLKIRDGDIEWTGFQGLASHGGAIGILIALAFYCKKYQQNFLGMLDKLVIPVALAGFFIRVGNLFNSEIIGKPSSAPWAFVFESVDQTPRHPSQLYEAFAYLIVFFVLLLLYIKRGSQLKKGLLFGLFLIMVFCFRFFIEFTKENQEDFENYLPFNMGQLLSIPFILAGIYFILRKPRLKTKEKEI